MACRELRTGRKFNMYLYGANPTCTPLAFNGNAIQHQLTINQGADIAAAPTTPTVITLAAALPADVYILQNQYFSAVAANGATVLLRASATANPGDSTVSVQGVPQLIADGSVINYPPTFDTRENAGFQVSPNLQTATFFGDDGWQRNSPSSFSATSDADGEFSQLDPAFWTLFRRLNDNYYNGLFLVQEYAAPNTDYVRGTVIVGQVVSNNFQIQTAADGRETFNGGLTFSGPPTVYEPLVA